MKSENAFILDTPQVYLPKNMDGQVDLSDPASVFDLAYIRFQLIRLEDTITFHLIERVQFPLNPTVYKPGNPRVPDPSLSLCDWMLREQERIHSLVRRYESPDEYPFFPEALHEPFLQPIEYPSLLHENNVNVNAKLKKSYLEQILPAAFNRHGEMQREESKENLGSTAVCDVACLQALSRRIHFGKFVAESKFRSETDRFVALIKAGDREGIDVAITDEKVEKKVLERLRLKAKTYGVDPSITSDSPEKINADVVVSLYKDFVIPLTKEVEVEYLMQRLKGTQWE